MFGDGTGRFNESTCWPVVSNLLDINTQGAGSVALGDLDGTVARAERMRAAIGISFVLGAFSATNPNLIPSKTDCNTVFTIQGFSIFGSSYQRKTDCSAVFTF